MEAGYAGTETAFNAALKDVPGHIESRSNPHGVTAAQVGAATDGITSNIDTHEVSGLFRVQGGSEGTFPFGNGPGVLIHKTWDVNYKEQLYFPHGSQKMYKRAMEGAVWQPWSAVYSSNMIPEIVQNLFPTQIGHSIAGTSYSFAITGPGWTGNGYMSLESAAAQVGNILLKSGTADIGAGAALANGTIYLCYE